MQEIMGHMVFELWIHASAGRTEVRAFSFFSLQKIVDFCFPGRLDLEELSSPTVSLHRSCVSVLKHAQPSFKQCMYGLAFKCAHCASLSANLKGGSLSVCQTLRCIRISGCQQLWRVWDFILLSSQEVSLAPFHLCWQKTWGSWSRDKRIYYSLSSRQREVYVHTGFPCSSSLVRQCRVVQGRLLPRLWVYIIAE